MVNGPPNTTNSGVKPPGLDVNAMLKARHGSTAMGMDVTALAAYPLTEMSALMQSPCRPEENGYFGATYGIPSKIGYEFEVEARPGANLEQAVLVVQEHLMDVTLSITFPTICSYEGDGKPPAKKTQDVVITGFRFGREELDLSRKFDSVNDKQSRMVDGVFLTFYCSLYAETCNPREDKGNYCNRFSGQLYIYGNDVENTVSYAQSVVHYAISGALPQVQSIGVQRVETVAIGPVNDDVDQSGFFALPLPVLSGLIVFAACIIFGVTLLYFYMKKDRVRHQKLHKMAQGTMLESLSGSFRCFTKDGRRTSEVDDESYTSGISSVQYDFEKGSMSKMPSEKIKVEFDPDYASSTGLISDTSTCSNTSREDPEGLHATMSHPPHYLDGHGRYRD